MLNHVVFTDTGEGRYVSWKKSHIFNTKTAQAWAMERLTAEGYNPCSPSWSHHFAIYTPSCLAIIAVAVAQAAIMATTSDPVSPQVSLGAEAGNGGNGKVTLRWTMMDF